MSRAFTREEDSENAVPDIGERPVSPHRNLVTQAGMVMIEAELASLREELAKAESAADKQRAAVLVRDLRYWMARRATAVLAPPPSGDAVQFGSRVTIVRKGREQRFRIVGVDEADPARGLISVHSPLAQAVIGARIGDIVEAREPLGEMEITKIG